MITLAGAGWELVLLPALGGAIGALRYHGVDVLRPTPAGATDPLHSACFPLVPYANRIADGRFPFGGRAIALPLNFGDHPHSLHGMGWQAGWELAERRDDRARLVHRHPGDGWPWRYHAEQMFELDETGCRVTLTLTNKASEPMPAGIGLHPYFPATPETGLAFHAQRVWLTDARQIPSRPAAADHFGDWSQGRRIAQAGFIDHSYEGWDGPALLDQGGRRIVMTATGARALHLYHPPGDGYCCLEPVTHLPDAFNRPDSLFDTLAPGATLTLAMRLSVEQG